MRSASRSEERMSEKGFFLPERASTASFEEKPAEERIDAIGSLLMISQATSS